MSSFPNDPNRSRKLSNNNNNNTGSFQFPSFQPPSQSLSNQEIHNVNTTSGTGSFRNLQMSTTNVVNNSTYSSMVSSPINSRVVSSPINSRVSTPSSLHKSSGSSSFIDNNLSSPSTPSHILQSIQSPIQHQSAVIWPDIPPLFANYNSTMSSTNSMTSDSSHVVIPDIDFPLHGLPPGYNLALSGLSRQSSTPSPPSNAFGSSSIDSKKTEYSSPQMLSKSLLTRSASQQSAPRKHVVSQSSFIQPAKVHPASRMQTFSSVPVQNSNCFQANQTSSEMELINQALDMTCETNKKR